jgi:hypothetical protein
MGFDSWHPEFNFSAAFEKTLSVWQEYMGLGTHGPMSFASDLSRNIFLLLFSFFLPESFLRYLWTFLMLLSGTLGMYYFLNISIFGRERNYSKDLSFLGALFYLFNLSTLQLFYTSFDGFMTQFGFLPWLFWSGKKLLDGYSKRNVLIFLVISFFSSSQAYTGTLFFAFLMFYFLYLLYESLIYPETKKRLFNLFRIFVIYFLANFFWLGPVLYAIVSGAENVSKTTINLLSSEESFFLNQKYGDLGSILELRNFWFDSTDYNNNFGSFDLLFNDWIKYLALPSSLWIHYFLTSIVILGLIYSLFVKKFRIFSFLFLLSVFFLTAGKEPFSVPYNFLRDNIPLLKEALRFPFTKFSIIASFIYAILFSLGISLIFDKVSAFLTNYKKSDRVMFLFSLLFLAIFVSRFFPYFEGKLLNPNTKVFFPEEYQRVFNHFSNLPSEERVFLAPADKFWAWSYYDFGYRGSGFLMYGLKQPVIYRSYDVWNKTNENIYWEINFALENNDEKMLADLINKYQIKHFVIDRNIVIPGKSREDVKSFSNKLQILLEKTKLVQKREVYGDILIVETKVPSGFLKTYKSLPDVRLFQGLRYYDSVYKEIGDYLISDDSIVSTNTNQVNYPYNFLNSLRTLNKENFEFIDSNKNKIKILSSNQITNEFKLNKSEGLYSTQIRRGELVLVPVIASNDTFSASIPASSSLVYLDNKNYLNLLNPVSKSFYIQGDSKLSFYQEKGTDTYLVNEFYAGKIELDSCSENPRGSFSYQFVNGNLLVTSTGNNQSLCLFSDIKKGVFEKGVPVGVQLKLFSSKDDSLNYCILDNQTKKCLDEGYLDESNNFSFVFTPIKDSNEYSLYLFPNFKNESNLKFEIGNILVTKYSLLTSLSISNLPKQLSNQKSEITLDLENINLQNKKYLNLCSKIPGENEFVSFINSEALFSNQKSVCLNLLEGTRYFKQNQTGYLAYINYTLENEKGVPICAGGVNECLTIDKLIPGKDLERVVIVPKNAQNLRVDLTSTVSENSSFRINSFKIAEIDLEGVSNLNNSQVLKRSSEALFLNNKRIFNWIYVINENEIGDSEKYLVLNQDNQKGWVAFCGSNLCKYEGSLNGYAKVWNIQGFDGKVVVVYLPQILLFLGLVFLTILFDIYS